MNVKDITNYILNELPEMPLSAVILGSGQGNFVDSMNKKINIPYFDIPDYPLSTVSGHAGEWIFGFINNKPIICASGRFHMYEGFNMEVVTLPVSIIHALGCKQLILTNAAGCLKRDWNIGEFMLIREYIDYTFSLKKGQPKTVKIAIEEQRLKKIRSASSNLRLQLREGIYTWVLGPSYETPAEIKDIISLGGNAVGMSTVPEIIKAIELCLDITCITCFTNYGSGLEEKQLLHSDVLETSGRANKDFTRLITEIVSLS